MRCRCRVLTSTMTVRQLHRTQPPCLDYVNSVERSTNTELLRHRRPHHHHHHPQPQRHRPLTSSLSRCLIMLSFITVIFFKYLKLFSYLKHLVFSWKSWPQDKLHIWRRQGNFVFISTHLRDDPCFYMILSASTLQTNSHSSFAFNSLFLRIYSTKGKK